MEPVRSLSSRAMSKMLEWRNPDGSEENWLSNTGSTGYGFPPLLKSVITQVGLGVLAICAAEESAAYIALIILSRPFFSDVSEGSLKRLQSSSFTVSWAAVDMLRYNLFTRNVCTHESFARRRCFSIVFREEDLSFCERVLSKKEDRPKEPIGEKEALLQWLELANWKLNREKRRRG